MLKRTLISLLVAIIAFVVITFLTYQLLVWLFPPIIVIDGVVHHTMTLGHAIYSIMAGGISTLIAFVIAFWKLKRINNQKIKK
ncbi:MAG: hypothetical protein Q4C98_10295 [Capnocytophaga sp.]|nr:hypothetical protein [Capnocytophaga sp.]